MMSDRALALTEDVDDYGSARYVVFDAAGGFMCDVAGAIDAYRAARGIAGARVATIPPAAAGN